MLTIANNISTRNPDVDRLLKQIAAGSGRPQQEATGTFRKLVECIASGADMLEINVQQHDDRPEVMEAAIYHVQQVADRPLCLSTNNISVLEAGLKACSRIPLVNYISMDEARLREMLPLAANYGAEVILLVSDPSSPFDARDMLGRAAVLVGAANEVGIPGDSVFLDPGLIHITHALGQRHLVEVKEFLSALPQTFDPPVKSTCWLANASAGAPSQLRPVIENTLLAVLSTLGLSSVFIDMLRPESVQTLRLLKVLNNELVYSEGELSLTQLPLPVI
ncbi:MAG: dihydropteroate synthase [Chloroflexi bacterium]|nr:dihydropteroate synthase [Chloroflexota bacterium]